MNIPFIKRKPKHVLPWKLTTTPSGAKLFVPKAAPANVVTDLRQTGWCQDLSKFQQGPEGCCTGHAWSYVYAFERAKQGLPPLAPSGVPSRQFVYYNERALESAPGNDLTQLDCGAKVMTGGTVLSTLGVPDESLWPYGTVDPNSIITVPKECFIKPSPAAYASALSDMAVEVQSVAQDLNTMLACLEQQTPIVIGFVCFPELESPDVAKTGDVPMPGLFEKWGWTKPIGGHCVTIVGADTSKGLFTFANWWGVWGYDGYGTLPFDYITNPNYASDFHCIVKVE